MYLSAARYQGIIPGKPVGPNDLFEKQVSVNCHRAYFDECGITLPPILYRGSPSGFVPICLQIED